MSGGITKKDTIKGSEEAEFVAARIEAMAIEMAFRELLYMYSRVGRVLRAVDRIARGEA